MIELSDYDMFCCMVDENLTQQHVAPKTIFEIIAAAIKEAEKMLRESKNVYEFNAGFKQSRGLPSLLQKSQCIDQYNVISWRENEYQRANEAIAPGGDGLGRGFIQHFLPANSVTNPNTLQTAIAAYYQERWREEGQPLLDESQRLLWKGVEANDKAMQEAALELEKQARVLFSQRCFAAGSSGVAHARGETMRPSDVGRTKFMCRPCTRGDNSSYTGGYRSITDHG